MKAIKVTVQRMEGRKEEEMAGGDGARRNFARSEASGCTGADKKVTWLKERPIQRAIPYENGFENINASYNILLMTTEINDKESKLYNDSFNHKADKNCLLPFVFERNLQKGLRLEITG